MAASSSPFNLAFNVIPNVGTDTSTGKRNVNTFMEAFKNPKAFYGSNIQLDKSVFQPEGSEQSQDNSSFKKPIPDLEEQLKLFEKSASTIMPLTVEQYRRMSQLATTEQMKQMAAYMPLSILAQRASIAANLQASKDYQAFLQQSPLAQQEIAASKQAQASAAAGSEADLLRAVATAQDVANRYPGYDTRRFAGQSSIG